MSLSIDWSRMKPGSIKSGEPGLGGHKSGLWKSVIWLLVLLLLVILGLGIWWSQ